jgi:hypothetical protein
MVYALVQTAIIAAAVVFSLQHLARKLMPRTMKRLTMAVLPGLKTKAESGGGCAESGTCGACNACGNIASILRDLPPR